MRPLHPIPVPPGGCDRPEEPLLPKLTYRWTLHEPEGQGKRSGLPVWLVALGVGLGAAGCGFGTGGAPVLDAGPTDGGVMDAGQEDAGTTNAGMADGGVPLSLEVVRGADQQGVTGVPLTVPVVIAAMDEQFSGVGGVSVALSTPLGATVELNPAITGGDGKALFSITLHAAGDHLFDVSAIGASSISFHEVGLLPDAGP